VDELKIDRSFIKEINERPQARSIVEGIVALAQSLGLQVVAEGVEDASVLPLLSNCGCATYQGFYFSPPMLSDKLLEVVPDLMGTQEPSSNDEQDQQARIQA